MKPMTGCCEHGDHPAPEDNAGHDNLIGKAIRYLTIWFADDGESPRVSWQEHDAEVQALVEMLRPASAPTPSQAAPAPCTPEDEAAAIKAAHPMRTGRHDLYAMALRLVGERHGKGELVDLVNWLLHRESRWGDLSDCLVTERQSAINAFREISKLVPHDSPIGQIADAECASLLHDNRATDSSRQAVVPR